MTDVVITGIGVVSAAGRGMGPLWHDACQGTTLAGPIRRLDVARSAVRVACEVPAFCCDDVLSEKEQRRMHRFSRYAVVAAHDAVADAFRGRSPSRDRCGVVVGTAFGGAQDGELGIQPDNPLHMPTAMANAAAAVTAMHLGWRGPNLSVSASCASGIEALDLGVRLLEEGRADAVLCGAAEAAVNGVVIPSAARFPAVATGAGAVYRPFDVDRAGLVIGEGAAMVVLERLEEVVAQGRPWYARVGTAHHRTACFDAADDERDDEPALRAVAGAAGHDGSVSFALVAAHASRLGDRIDATACRAAFGERVPVTAPIAETGHMMGAAGAALVAFAARALAERWIPPTGGCRTPDPALGIDVVTGAGRPLGDSPAATAVVVRSFAGQCSALRLDVPEGVAA